MLGHINITGGLTLIGIMIVIALVALFIMGYVKAPPNVAFIISGLKKKPRVLIGRAGFKVPFLERIDKLRVGQISIDIKTGGYIPTKDYIGVDIDAVAKVRLLTEDDITVDDKGELINPSATKRITKEMVQAAMRNFLNMDEKKIIAALTDSLQGNMREIIGTQDLQSLCNDRKKFGDEVQAKAQVDMNAMGVWIISCNIQSIKDKEDLINALGQDNMSQIKKTASIAKARAEKEVNIEQAIAHKESKDAEIKAATEVAIKENELKIKQSELKKESDIKQAEADAAYKIQDEVQRKTIEITKAEANIAQQEKEVELKRREAEVKEQELSATIRKQADADKYKRQQQAEALLIERQKQAEAEKFEVERKMEAQRIRAEADKYKAEQEAEAIKAKAIAEAEGTKAKGIAEAEAIQAKGIAEAEAMEKKAEAYKKYNNAAVTEMIVKQLPDIAKAIASPIQAIDKITVIDSGDGKSGVECVGGYTPAILTKVIESVKETTGFDLTDVMKANTYDAKVNKNLHVDGIESLSKLVKNTDKKSIEVDDLVDNQNEE